MLAVVALSSVILGSLATFAFRGTPAPPVPRLSATYAAIGTYTPLPSGTPTATQTPTPSRTPQPTIMVWWYAMPLVMQHGSATPYPTPTRINLPPGATERPTSTRAPGSTRGTPPTPYPAPPTRTATPRATVPRSTATRFRGTATSVPIAAQGEAISGTAYLYVMSVSVYVPMAGPDNDWIDGSACYGKPWQDCFVQTGDAACGSGWPRGTVFILQDDMAAHGLPSRVVCRDRGNLIFNGNLDLALVSADSGTDLETARGRRGGCAVAANESRAGSCDPARRRWLFDCVWRF